MRHIGIDYGTKRIGVALSDESGTLAFPETILQNDGKAVGAIVALARERGAEDIVVGEPLPLAGGDNPLMKSINSFVDALKRFGGMRVHLEKEFLTSREAQRHTASKHEDAAAAALILQRYLDKRATTQ